MQQFLLLLTVNFFVHTEVQTSKDTMLAKHLREIAEQAGAELCQSQLS